MTRDDVEAAPQRFYDIALRAAETLRPGDWIIFDRQSGRYRLAKPADEGQRYVLPANFEITSDGNLRIPVPMPAAP